MPATPTYVALAEVTLAATATSVTLPVPSGYRDVVLITNGSLSGSSGVQMRVNGDSGSNYSEVTMLGNSGGAQSYSYSGQTQVYLTVSGIDAGQRIDFLTQFFDVSAIDKHKTILNRHNANGNVQVEANASRWANTSAITSIYVFANASTFAAGTTFTMFGIEA